MLLLIILEKRFDSGQLNSPVDTILALVLLDSLQDLRVELKLAMLFGLFLQLVASGDCHRAGLRLTLLSLAKQPLISSQTGVGRAREARLDVEATLGTDTLSLLLKGKHVKESLEPQYLELFLAILDPLCSLFHLICLFTTIQSSD